MNIDNNYFDILFKNLNLNNSNIKKSKFVKTIYCDHKHCVFCWHKFMDIKNNEINCSNIGYCTLNENYWICENCFKKYMHYFNWNY